MERPSGFRTSHVGLLTPYRYGERKYEDYLLDTQTYIYDGAREQVAAIDRVGRMAAEQATEQANLLRDYIAQVGGAWDQISCQLDTLTNEVAYGFSSLERWLKYNASQLEQILGQLGQIARTLNNPLATQANELVRSGEHLLERGLNKEAYDDLTAAEAKRPVNPMLHLHLAQLHYRVLEDGVPFDLVAAEKHINLAIRYARSLRGDLGERRVIVFDLVFGGAAHLALVKGGDLCKLTGPEAGNAELRRADEFLLCIDQPSPSSQFLHAQVLALLGRLEESYAKVRALADFTRSWIPRALCEPNLSSIADRIGSLGQDLKTCPGKHSHGAYSAVLAGHEFAVKSKEIAKEFDLPSRQLFNEIDKIEQDFELGVINASSVVSNIEEACAPLKSKINTWIAMVEAERNRIDREVKIIAEKIETERNGIADCWKMSGIAVVGELAVFLIAQVCTPAANSRTLLGGIFGSLGVIIFGLMFYAGFAIVPIMILYSIVIAIKRKLVITKHEDRIRTLQAR